MPLQITPAARDLLSQAAGTTPALVKLHIAGVLETGMVFDLVLLEREPQGEVLLLDGPLRVFAYEHHAPILETAIVDAADLPEGGQGLVIAVPDEKKWLSCGSECTGLGKDDCGGMGPCGGKGCHFDEPGGHSH